MSPRTSTRCRSPIAATAPARCSATRSRAPAASASSCSSTPTRSARPRVAADAEICMMAADTMEAARHPARLLCRRGQQPQGARRRDGGDRPRRRRECRPPPHRAARHRQARQARAGGRARCCSAPAARTRAATSPRAPGSSEAQIETVLGYVDAPEQTTRTARPTSANPLLDESARAAKASRNWRDHRRSVTSRRLWRRPHP